MRAGRKLGWCRLMPDLKWPRFVINESYTQPPKALSILAQSRSDIREQWRNLLGRSRISLTLNPGYKAGAHPGYETTEAKTYPPLFAALGQGSPSFLSSVSLDIEGDGAPTRRSARITPGGLSGLLRTMGRETSRPAPCGAPTRHLGLYAFDGGRTGPAR